MHRTVAGRADRRREQGRSTSSKTSTRGRRTSKSQDVCSRTTSRKACSAKGERGRTAIHPTRDEIFPGFPGSLAHLDLTVTPWSRYCTGPAGPSSRESQYTSHPTRPRKRTRRRQLESRLRSHFAGYQSTTHRADHQRPCSFQSANRSRSKVGEEMDWQEIRMARLLRLNDLSPDEINDPVYIEER